MPYIKRELRKQYDDVIDQLPVPANAGELNYVLTRIAIKYFNLAPNSSNYQTINDIAGAFSWAALEFNRRVTSIYEDQKKSDNGDVYP
jgi:hypothetical protein